MSDKSPANATDADHTGLIRTPKQLLQAIFISFVLPIFIIIGLVLFVVSGFKPAGLSTDTSMALSGMTDQAHAKAMAERLQKVGRVEIRDAAREMKSGEQVYQAQCTACHAAGAAGAPKFGDVAAWSPRIKTGYETLLNSALKGKGAMGAQSGGDFEEYEIARAVVYMTNAAGAKFAAPTKAEPVTN